MTDVPNIDVVPITREVPVIHGEIDVSSGTLTYRTCRTNADRIRQMSDEELAEIITGDWCEMLHCETPCDGLCELRVLAWLQSPADGGDVDAKKN